MIVNREPYLKIAKKFGLNHVSVNAHGKAHVLPFVESIELQANAIVLERVMAYRDEVNLPLPEKSKFIENKLWGDYYATDRVQDRIAIAKAINQQQQEQARLAGAYLQDKQHPADRAALLSETAKMLADRCGYSPKVALELATLADEMLHGEGQGEQKLIG